MNWTLIVNNVDYHHERWYMRDNAGDWHLSCETNVRLFFAGRVDDVRRVMTALRLRDREATARQYAIMEAF
jgi:hypothetical protein